MKKLTLGVATCAIALLSINAAQAQDSYVERTELSPYVGVYGGYGWTNINNALNDGDLNGADYGVYAGIQGDAILDRTINRLGLGITGAIEAHYGMSGQDDTENGISFEKEHEWGVNFKPGLSFLNNDYIVEVAPYGILGYRGTQYDVGGNDENYHGFELGLGTEVLAFDNAAVRLEYTHVFYSEENGLDPDEDNIRLGLGYKF